MIIISNPPYGKNSALGRKIIKSLTAQFEKAVFLATVTAYKYTDYEHWQTLEELDFNPFEDASFTGGLMVGHWDATKKGPFENYEDVTYQKAPAYVKDYLTFQQTHERTYKVVTSTFSTWHWTDEQVKEFAKQHPREKIFVQTHWNIANGVHTSDSAFDVAFNLHNADFSKKTDCWFLEFETEKEAENIKKWYYRHGKDGLANFIYKSIICAVYYFPADAIPHIEWNKENVEYTDEYVLSQLGLKWKNPQDFSQGLVKVQN